MITASLHSCRNEEVAVLVSPAKPEPAENTDAGKARLQQPGSSVSAHSASARASSVGELFVQYLDAARLEALAERESSMFALRYGLSGGCIHTLAEIGEQYGLSRERVRQLLARSHRRIIAMAQRQQRASQTGLPCIDLASYLAGLIRPEQEGSHARFLRLVTTELTFLPVNSRFPEFIARLAYPSRDLALRAAAEVQQDMFQMRDDFKEPPQEAVRKSSRSQQMDALIFHTTWPRRVRKLAPEDLHMLKRHRDVSPTGKGKAGLFFSGRLGRHVQFESALESRFIRQLETYDPIIAYQEQPLEIPYTVNGRQLTYFPDFLLISRDHRGTIVEIKPVFQMALRDNLVKFEALRLFCGNHGFGFLITDGRTTIDDVRRHRGNSRYVDHVLSCLAEGPIGWERYKEMLDTYVPSTLDFAAMILNYHLCWQLGPFRLSLDDCFRSP